MRPSRGSVWRVRSSASSALSPAKRQQQRTTIGIHVGKRSRGRHFNGREIFQYRFEHYLGASWRGTPIVGDECDFAAILRTVMGERSCACYELFKYFSVF